MISQSLIFGTLVALFGQIEVIETAVPAYKALLVDVSPDALTVVVEGQEREIPRSGLRKIKFPVAPQTKGPIAISLRDGSTILARELSSEGANCTITLGDGLRLSVDAKYVSDVQLRELTEMQLVQWESLRQSRLAGDMLALIRSPESLDRIEGIIHSISSEAVQFEFSGQKIPAPLSKLAGIRFFSKAESSDAKLSAILRDTHGGVWNVASISLPRQSSKEDPQSVEIILRGGLQVTLPLSELAEIDFSVGSMKYLAEVEPLERTTISRFDLGITLAGSEEIFGARTVSNRKLSPSIEFLGGGSATYRVPADFTRLIGTVELTPPGNQFTPCNVRVLVEKKVVWEVRLETIKQAEQIDVPVTGDQRVQLVVQPESKNPVGDVVLFRELRFLK